MKIFLLGATGPTGQQIVSLALQQGHEITAFVRNPSKLSQNDTRLRTVTGDIFDSEALSNTMKGYDLVISALGVGKNLKPDGLITRATTALIPAMKKAGLQRVIFLSAFGVGDTIEQATLIFKIIFKTFLRSIYADKKVATEQLKGSGLQWTLISPVLLTDGPRTGGYRIGEKLELKGMAKISRADVAEFMLREANDNRWIQKEVILSY